MAWGLDHLSSHELSEWIALARIEHEEREHARHLAESGDGKVHMSGRDELPDEDDGEQTE